MESIVLAGGFGTRLQSVVSNVPKPMAPIGGRPFLEYLLTSLSNKGFKKTILAVGYMHESITSYFGNTYKELTIDYVIEEKPLGTGGSTRLALEKTSSDHIYVFNGDTFLEFDIAAAEKMWSISNKPLIVAREVDCVSRYGSLILENNRIIDYKEKGDQGPGIINAGCYILKPEELDSFPLNHPFSLETDYLYKYIRLGDFMYIMSSGIFIDIGIPSDYHRSFELLSHLKL